MPVGKSLVKIQVLGIGNGGGNAVNRMIEEGLCGVDFVAVNTDVRALTLSKAPQLVLIGSRVTKGLGAAGDPDIGVKAAEESSDALYEVINGSDMVFITASMEGDTGTGGAPIIARIARETGALTIGVVSLPYAIGGPSRDVLEGIEKLKENVDTLIAIASDLISSTVPKINSLLARIEKRFRLPDETLGQGIQAISDLLTVPGLINLEFDAIRAIMADGAVGTMAVGQADGANKAVTAAEQAIASPLLNVTIDGARAILLNITGGPDLSLSDIEKAAEVIREAAHPTAKIMFGAVNDETMIDKIRITIIAMGFDPSAAPETRRRPGRRPEGSPSLSPLPGSSPSPILTQVRAGRSSEETEDAPQADARSRQLPEQEDRCTPSKHSA